MSLLPSIPISSIQLLVSAFLAAGTTGGTSYAFGIYGQALKSNLHLTQSQLDTISSANFAAGMLSWIPGLMVDQCGIKFGMVGGGILGAMALVSFWTVATQHGQGGGQEQSQLQLQLQLHDPPFNTNTLVAILSSCAVVIFMASALITGSVFKIMVQSTSHEHRGQAVGAAKGYVGLGSGAYAVLFESLRRSTDLDFLPMAAFFFIAAASLPALCLLPTKRDEHVIRVDTTTSAHYSSLYMGLVAMAVLVIGQSIVELLSSNDQDETSNNNNNFQNSSQRKSEKATPDYLMSLMVPLVWFGPILGLLILPRKKYDALTTNAQDAADDEALPLKVDSDTNTNAPFTTDIVDDFEDEIDGIGGVAQVAAPVIGDYTLRQMLGTASAWLMLWTCTILVGGGTVMTNNLGQMVQALRFDPKVVPAALSLFSVAQSLGRVMTGSLSSMAKRRTSFLILASVAGLGSHAVLAVTTELVSFIGGVFLSGLAFGMVWPLMVLITGELFGASHVGANYMVSRCNHV